MKYKIVGISSLEGCKVGFCIPEERTIYVSPSVAKLASSDLGLLKNLRVFKRGAKNKGLDLDTWVLQTAAEHTDIFGESDGTEDQ